MLRVAYLAESLSLPFIEGPLFDSLVYLRQAEAIWAGELDHPTLLAFSPLYGYFLAAFGSAPRLAPILAQLALGLFTLYLFQRASAWLLSDERAALCAAALLAGYGPVLSYETKLMSESLSLALLVTALAFYAAPAFRHRGPVALAFGVTLGLAILARASLLFTAPFFVLAAALPFRGRDPTGDPTETPAQEEARPAWPGSVMRAGWVTLGLVLVLGAHGLANLARTGLFVPVILTSRTAAEATRQSGGWDGRFDTFGEAPSAWDVVDQAEARLERARRGEAEPSAPGIDVSGFAAGFPQKLALTLRDTETSFDYGYYGERSELRALSLAPITFGGLACLALVGAVMLGRRRGVAELLRHLPIVLGVIALTTLFHPSTRYRLPIVLPLAMLGGYAISWAWTRHGRQRVAALLAVATLLVAFAIPTYAGRVTRPAMWEVRVAEAAISAGWLEEALERVERARALAPDDPEIRDRIERLGYALDRSGDR